MGPVRQCCSVFAVNLETSINANYVNVDLFNKFDDEGNQVNNFLWLAISLKSKWIVFTEVEINHIAKAENEVLYDI